MSKIYVDEERKQIVFEDTDEKIVDKISRNDLVKKLIDYRNKYSSQNLEKYFYYYVLNNPSAFDVDILTYRCKSNVTYSELLNSIITESIKYFNKAGMNINYHRYDARITISRYCNETTGSDIYDVPGWSSPRGLNNYNWSGSGYFTDKVGHVCIFCIKKDPSIVGGNLDFFPRYEEQFDVYSSHLMGCLVPCTYTTLTIPLRTGSVVLLSGDVYHQLQDMKIKRGEEMCLVVAEFFYGYRDYHYNIYE